MKKVLKGKVNYCGKPGRITCTITDENGYISITGGIIPYRCKTEHAGGCIHEYICKAFPKLKKYIGLHLCGLDGKPMHYVANSLYFFMNNEPENAKNTLRFCTESELKELQNLVLYGLHRTKRSYGYTYDENTLNVYTKALEKYNIPERAKESIKEFYAFLDTL